MYAYIHCSWLARLINAWVWVYGLMMDGWIKFLCEDGFHIDYQDDVDRKKMSHPCLSSSLVVWEKEKPRWADNLSTLVWVLAEIHQWKLYNNKLFIPTSFQPLSMNNDHTACLIPGSPPGVAKGHDHRTRRRLWWITTVAQHGVI